MKRLLRSPFAALLALSARAILRKYHPKVIMVTGSVGKTSTKDAIAAALRGSTRVRASEKSYNSEFGVPLTILGVENPWLSLSGWLKVFKTAFAFIFFTRPYPKTLVLEVGADRPGDLARILRIATPDTVVVTRLPEVPVHVEAYTTPHAVREEEFAPAYALSEGAPLIVSSRDTYAIEMAKNTRAHMTTVGFSSEADVRISEPTLLIEKDVPVGMTTTATVAGEEYPLVVRGALGNPQVLAPAAALALAIALGIKPSMAISGLRAYVPPPGRARLLQGMRNSILIDDSYNASPPAVEEALDALNLIHKGCRFAVLGDMLELGRYSASEHERIGELASGKADVLVTVGQRSRAMAEAAKRAGMPEERVRSFDTATYAAEYLKHAVQEGDAVLIKGSQSMRMEQIVEALLADPADTKYLVRQEKEWKKR